MISVENLTKFYGKFCALDDVSFKIGSNEIVALLGLNGAGKTTVLRILTGFLTPTSGDVAINKFGLLENSMDLRRQIGYMPENPALYLDMSVDDFLRHMYRIRLYTKDGEDEAVDRALIKTSIVDRRADLIGKLSAGFRKRVALAQAIVHNPPVLIFDEPISDLDPLQIIEIRNLLLELKKDHTILISSHILSEVSRTADRYFFLHEGRLVAQETPDSLRKYLKTAFEYDIELASTSADGDQIGAQIKSIKGVKKADLVSEKEGKYRFEIQSEHDIRSELSRNIIDWKYDLLQVNQREMNLESLFINLTRAQNTAA